MFALPLLLSVAAGVNAILGGEVSAVKISNTSFICADDCAHEGVFFAQSGYFCPEKEAVLIVSPDGPDWPIYDCTGARHPDGSSERQLVPGEQLPKCDVTESDDYEPDLCISDRDVGDGNVHKLIQWSDVEKELESSATSVGGGQGTPEENQPGAPKSLKQCAEIGRQVFLECRRESDEPECLGQSREAFENCWPPKKNESDAQKTSQQCAEIGKQVFIECRQKLSNHECYEQSREAFASCEPLP